MSERSMLCVKCGTANNVGAKFCRACGDKIDLSVALVTTDFATCPKCGCSIKPSMKFCAACGTSISTSAPISAASCPAPTATAPIGQSVPNQPATTLLSRFDVQGKQFELWRDQIWGNRKRKIWAVTIGGAVILLITLIPVAISYQKKVEQREVERAFLNHETRSHPSVKVDGPVLVASQYALLGWGDENTGGQAVLKYDRSIGWSVLATEGGAMGRSDLIRVGVPMSIAKGLCDLRKAADTSPNQEWRKESPDTC